MRIFLILIALTLTTAINAQYIFTGSGNWSDASNWQGGLKPPATISGGVTVSIQGTAITSQGMINDIDKNYGDITIEAGGSLTIRNGTQFQNYGSFIVKGTYINNTVWENYPGANVIVWGTLKNQFGLYASGFTNKATVTINNGGIFRNEQGTYRNNALSVNEPAGILIINSGGTFLNISPATAVLFGNITNNGTFTNSSVMNGEPTISGNLSNEGTLAPGSSPGAYTIDGDYSASLNAIHNFEVAGTATSNYDRINSSGTVNLNGTLNVSLTGGFTPSSPHSLPIITGTVNGTFTSVNLPANYTIIYNPTNVTLQYGSVLPVNFVNLDAKREVNEIKLIWSVSGEQNLLSYEVEKSTDGRNFVKIGEVPPSGQSKYSYSDRNPCTKAFYRIKSLDADGKFKYSIILNFSNGRPVIMSKVYPVPAQNEIYFQHSTAEESNLITIYSIDGRAIQSTKASVGSQQTAISISSFTRGLYFVSYTNKGQPQEIVQFIKQ